MNWKIIELCSSQSRSYDILIKNSNQHLSDLKNFIVFSLSSSGLFGTFDLFLQKFIPISACSHVAALEYVGDIVYRLGSIVNISKLFSVITKYY